MRALDQDTALAVSASNDGPDGGRLDLMIAGSAVRVDGLDSALLARARDVLRPFAADAPHASPAARIRVVPRTGASGWSVTHGGEEVMSTSNPDGLLTYLDWYCIAQGLEVSSRAAIFHAAALVRDCVVVLLVAGSGAGKTTLTLGLMQRGWEPLADDIALVNCETLAIAAFPRCFHVDDATKSLLTDPSSLEWPAELGGHARPRHWATGGLRPHTIVIVERRSCRLRRPARSPPPPFATNCPGARWCGWRRVWSRTPRAA